MPASSWGRWINPMSISLRAYLQQYPLIKNQQTEILGLRSVPSQRFMTTYVCFMHVQVSRTAQIVVESSAVNHHNKSLIEFLKSPKVLDSKSLLLLFGNAKVNTLKCFAPFKLKVFPEFELMAPYMAWKIHLSLKSKKSTQSMWSLIGCQ
ncbi:unannotated protein [freshwater metagenome]|uniref:Unannotated protein n=1 Tax=freshwater metagenome TaxID=449393 RepID=A0A6J5ZQP8_9ZZZZ